MVVDTICLKKFVASKVIWKRSILPPVIVGVFLRKEFEGRELHDTVYITANPYSYKLPDDTFHDIINILECEWNEELLTVEPEKVADSVRKAMNDYPNKRIIAHFMQPHYPLIGKTGRRILQGGISPKGGGPQRSKGGDIWVKMQFGMLDISTDEVWKAYRENLNIVLEEVEDLVEDIEGKSVITADHGNMVGERGNPIPVKTWGHPPNIRTPELIEVPWFVIEENKKRRNIISEEPKKREKLDTEIAEERLKDLGYT